MRRIETCCGCTIGEQRCATDDLQDEIDPETAPRAPVAKLRLHAHRKCLNFFSKYFDVEERSSSLKIRHVEAGVLDDALRKTGKEEGISMRRQFQQYI